MKKWVVGNWKMNGSLDMMNAFVPAFLDTLMESSGWETRVRVGICPPSAYLCNLTNFLTGYPVDVGAQNVHHESHGAFTGEVSPAMLKDVGVKLSLVGHSERRQLFGETDVQVREKLNALVAEGLTAILCVGETLAERESGKESEIVATQVNNALDGFDGAQSKRLVVAYEPIWAIGTGKTASPQQANEMHAHIRGILRQALGDETGNDIPVLYGGSVNPENADSLIAEPEINGMLVGGASLKPETFLSIIQSSNI